YPVFDTAVGKVGLYICYDRHFPEGWRELGLNGAEMVFNPNATKPGLSNRLWEVEGPAAAVANGYFVLQPNRVGREDNEYGELAVDFYGTSQVIDPRGNFVGERGSGTDEEVLIRDLDMDLVRQMRDDWQFYRDRRPESYTSIPKP
ncbi:MAG: acyltransferase, partial [Microbacteriaceae bacterium]|nr:acyltransferase [Microbacteriaceae bacterium]